MRTLPRWVSTVAVFVWRAARGAAGVGRALPNVQAVAAWPRRVGPDALRLLRRPNRNSDLPETSCAKCRWPLQRKTR